MSAVCRARCNAPDDARRVIAERVVEHLEKSGFVIEKPSRL
jgi:hypothetical protein